MKTLYLLYRVYESYEDCETVPLQVYADKDKANKEKERLEQAEILLHQTLDKFNKLCIAWEKENRPPPRPILKDVPKWPSGLCIDSFAASNKKPVITKEMRDERNSIYEFNHNAQVAYSLQHKEYIKAQREAVLNKLKEEGVSAGPILNFGSDLNNYIGCLEYIYKVDEVPFVE